MSLRFEVEVEDVWWSVSSLADLHGFFIVWTEELKVLVGLDGLPAVLTHIKHCQSNTAASIDHNHNIKESLKNYKNNHNNHN